MTQVSQGHPVIRLFAGAIVVSFAPILVRATDVPPTTSAFYRMLIGGVTLALYLMLTRSSMVLNRRIVSGLTLAGLFFALDLFLWHRSIFFVGPGLATLLAGFQVFVLAIVGVLFLSERWVWSRMFAIVLALLGVALIVSPRSLTSTYGLGVLFGLLTALAYAGVLLSLRWVRVVFPDRNQPIADVVIMSLSSVVFLFFITLITEESLKIPDNNQAFLLVSYAITAQLGWVLIVEWR